MKQHLLPNIPTASFLKGIDVSHYQGAITWSLVKKAGISFAFAKATEGSDLVDDTFAANWAGARAAKVTRGAYHLFRPKDSVQSQVDIFVKTVDKLLDGDLPPVLDLEVPSDWTSIPVANRMPLIIEWLTKVKAALGVTPIVYMSPSFVTDTLGGNASALSGYPLWIANYGVSTPTVPSAWKTWLYWQYSETGKMNGISGGDVDLDYYNGTALDLRMATYSSTSWRRLLKTWWCKFLRFLGFE